MISNMDKKRGFMDYLTFEDIRYSPHSLYNMTTYVYMYM